MDNTQEVEQPKDRAAQSAEAKEAERYKRIAAQLQEEFKMAERHVRSRREAWRTFLKLYINQRKDPKKVGVPRGTK